MRIAIILAVSLLPVVAHAAAGVPKLDIRKTCQAAQGAQNGLSDPMKKCMADENAAKAQLTSIWGKAKPQARSVCGRMDADSPYKSYADIVTCMQMYQ
jgi:hypothetical protein